MASPLSSRPPGEQPPDLSARAMENLRFIRETMESAGQFTAVPGWGGVAMGASALGAAFIAAQQTTNWSWLQVWLTEAVVGIVIGATTMIAKARSTSTPLASGQMRKFVLAFVPAILVGALLTIAFHKDGVAVLPGVWLLCYGAAITSAGAFSVRIVPLMGLCFMLAGAVALRGPQDWGNPLLGLGFGLLHIGFGIAIARRHGG